MPVSPTYPGVYVQEVPSGVRTIGGVSTSITLFVGRTLSGPMNEPLRLTNYSDFSRAFTDDNSLSDMARYVKLFFMNGGTDCYVMRIARGAVRSSVTLKSEAGTETLRLTAKRPGSQGDSIRAEVRYNGTNRESTFNLELFRWQVDARGQRSAVEREVWNDLTMDPASPRYAPTFLTQKSAHVGAEDLKAAPLDGFSMSCRPVATEPADAATFIDRWTRILGTAAGPKNRFQISVDGNPFVEADLSPIDVSSIPTGSLGASKNALQDAIAQRISVALATAGIMLPSPPVKVTLESGPTPQGTGETTLLKIASLNKKSIYVRSAANPAQDLAAVLLLGQESGGLEVGAHAARRPAPTGITLSVADPTTLTAFAGLLQTDIVTISLPELQASGKFAETEIPVDLHVFSDSKARMWQDAAGNATGLREKLVRICDAINAYRALHGSTFFFRAELWGLRIAILPTAGEDTALSSFSTATTDLMSGTTRFISNVRYYSLGSSGVLGYQTPGKSGNDGSAPGAKEYQDAYALADSTVDLFNLLVLPPDHDDQATPLEQLWSDASVFCQKRRALLLMDPPDSWRSSQEATTGVDGLRVGLVKDFSALYFPRLKILEGGTQVTVGPAGAIAGLYARTDANRGVWKAPAGTEASLLSVAGVDVPLSDSQNGQINPVGVNAIRVFPDGIVSWGARTMAGADAFASEYKYIPIRRLALYIEESLYRGLKWVVFEPNDAPLWSQIRLNVGAFMHNLFRQGAFQGQTPKDSFFVKCDAETTTQNDRNLGMVNIWVGFAPLKPAEFVVLYLQQIAGQIES